jgi:hypothetical protein
MQEEGNHGVENTVFSKQCSKTHVQASAEFPQKNSTAPTKIWKVVYIHDFHPRHLQREGNILSTDHTSRVQYFERL